MNLEERQIIGDEAFLDHVCRWSLYSPDHNIHYIPIPKAANTTLKWWFAELIGISKKGTDTIDFLESVPELMIHDLFARYAPAGVTSFTLEQIKALLDSESVFRFSAVRNPFTRMFSAWQSKILLAEPVQCARYRDTEWFNRPLNRLEDIASAFQGFVEHVAAYEAPHFADPHWTLQTNFLRNDRIRYDVIAQVEEPAPLKRALAAHLGDDVKDPLGGPRINETLLPAANIFFTDRSVELIRDMYRPDFIAFGYPLTLPKFRTEITEGQFAVAIQAIHLIRGRLHPRGKGREHLCEYIVRAEDTLRLECDAITQERDALAARCETAERDRDALAGRCEAAERDRDVLAGRCESAERDREALLRSTSWRVTAPMRWIRGLF